MYVHVTYSVCDKFTTARGFRLGFTNHSLMRCVCVLKCRRFGIMCVCACVWGIVSCDQGYVWVGVYKVLWSQYVCVRYCVCLSLRYCVKVFKVLCCCVCTILCVWCVCVQVGAYGCVWVAQVLCVCVYSRYCVCVCIQGIVCTTSCRFRLSLTNHTAAHEFCACSHKQVDSHILSRYQHLVCHTYVNESCHTYEWGRYPHTVAIPAPGVSHICERVMSHAWTSHVTHMNKLCNVYEWVMSHVWMR